MNGSIVSEELTKNIIGAAIEVCRYWGLSSRDVKRCQGLASVFSAHHTSVTRCLRGENPPSLTLNAFHCLGGIEASEFRLNH
jgi:hypothetical protein